MRLEEADSSQLARRIRARAEVNRSGIDIFGEATSSVGKY